VPIQDYTNWQLIRFKEKGVKKIASSRYNRNIIVDDDIIFKRVLTKEKRIYRSNVIKLNSYEEVKNIILSDINFLKKVGSYAFNLLLMYYEYEGNQKHEKYVQNGVIKIKTNISNKPEIIDDILPNGCLYDPSLFSDEDEEIEEEISNSIKNVNINKSSPRKNTINSKSKNSVNSMNSINSKNKTIKENEIQLISEDISDDFPNKRKISENIINYSDQINITGYNGNFDDYNCLCFFNFENIFQNQEKYQYNYKFYKDYLKKILKYFSPLNRKSKDFDIYKINIEKIN
jgi:hypothetical protein